jgi:hypothetical protein
LGNEDILGGDTKSILFVVVVVLNRSYVEKKLSFTL